MLARRIREKLTLLEEAGSCIKVKIVERGREKIVDLLHKSNPWKDKDCERKECVLCSSAGEKDKRGICKKRNIVYEIFCLECGVREDKDDKEDKNKAKKGYKFKYIGETNRSGFERGKEHSDMRRNYNEKSFMLKHCLLHHKGRNPEEIKFGMKLRKQYRTALERQVGEAVAILEEKERGTQLMNSKSEFSSSQDYCWEY